jgi:hypothetical protein
VVWLERHAWWGLMFFALTLVSFGVSDLIVGATADPGIPLGLTGLTPAELEAEGASAYRMFDFMTRANGFSLLFAGLLMAAILIFAFRENQRWAWWAMWLFPTWAVGVLIFYLVAGTVPEEPPPPPMLSGPFLAAIAAAILLVSAPRFFRSGLET